MNDLYIFLSDLMPIKRVLISLAIGISALLIVFISGLTSEVVRTQIIAYRAFYAFSFFTLTSFILFMCGEEYAIFINNRNYERFIDDAKLEDFDEDFNSAVYLLDNDDTSPADQDSSTADLGSVNLNNLPIQN